MRSEIPLTPEQLEAVFDSLDVNKNGYVTIEQFLSGFGEYNKRIYDSSISILAQDIMLNV
jgi:Ca2+-binding EF-hand superfamily protein